MHKRMIDFLSANPQDLAMITHTVRAVSTKCLARWKDNQALVKEYIALRAAGKADKVSDYMGTLNIIRQTFLPTSNPAQARDKEVVAVSSVDMLAAQGGSALQEFVRLLAPRLMNIAVAPVLGIMVDLVRSIAGSTLQMIDGMVGYVPYVGPAISQIVSQVIWASSNFMVARLEEMLHSSVSSVFTRLTKKAPLIANVVIREYSQDASIQNDLDSLAKNGFKAVKAGFGPANARAQGSESIEDTIFGDLKDKHLKTLTPIALNMMGLMRVTFYSLRKTLSDCDATSLVLADTFAMAKP